MLKFERKQSTRGVFYPFPKCVSDKQIPSRSLCSDSVVCVVPKKCVWKDSSSEDHHEYCPEFTIHKTNIPLLVPMEQEMRLRGDINSFRESPDKLRFVDEKKVQRQALRRAIAKHRETFLPLTENEDDIYAKIKEHHNLITSMFILINKERQKRNIIPLCREHELEELASDQAQRNAERRGKKHSDLNNIISKITDPSDFAPFRRIGENVCGGKDIDGIHKKMMTDPRYQADRNNIFDTRFSSFGIGVAICSNGKVYICQIYKG